MEKQKIAFDCLALMHVIKIDLVDLISSKFKILISKKTLDEIEKGIDNEIPDLTIPDCEYAKILIENKKISVEQPKRDKNYFTLKRLGLQGEAIECIAIALQQNCLLVSNDWKLIKTAESMQLKAANVPELVVSTQGMAGSEKTRNAIERLAFTRWYSKNLIANALELVK